MDAYLGLEAAGLVLTQVGYNPLDDSASPPFAVGDQVVALAVDRELAWRGGTMRPILRPFNHFASSLLLAQPDGTFAGSDGQASLTLEEIRAQLTEEADYPDQITVKIDLFGGYVYNFGEFPYCNDVAPEAQPQSVWLAASGTLTVSVNGPVPEETCAGDGFEVAIRLENVLFRREAETVQLDEIFFEDVAVGWCPG